MRICMRPEINHFKMNLEFTIDNMFGRENLVNYLAR